MSTLHSPRRPVHFRRDSLLALPPSVSLSDLVASYRDFVFADTGRRPDLDDALKAIDRLHEDLWDRATADMAREWEAEQAERNALATGRAVPPEIDPPDDPDSYPRGSAPVLRRTPEAFDVAPEPPGDDFADFVSWRDLAASCEGD